MRNPLEIPNAARLESLGHLSEAARQYLSTERHAHRVTALAVRIAQRMGLDAKQRKLLDQATPFHDLGKRAWDWKARGEVPVADQLVTVNVATRKTSAIHKLDDAGIITRGAAQTIIGGQLEVSLSDRATFVKLKRYKLQPPTESRTSSHIRCTPPSFAILIQAFRRSDPRKINCEALLEPDGGSHIRKGIQQT